MRCRASATGLLGLLLAACASSPPPAQPKPQPEPAPEPAPSAAQPGEPGGGCAALAARAPEPPSDVIGKPVPAIVRRELLAPFFDELAALERGVRKEPVRIGIWGDSNLTLDEVSGALRRALQQRFGDAGHGFVGVGNPFRGYRHMDVRRTLIGHWETYIFTRGKKPRRGGFGAAGMAAATGERRARVRFETAAAGAPVGTRASSFGLFYLKAPGAGRFAIRVDGQRRAPIDAAAEPRGVGYARVEVEDGPHQFEVENVERGRWLHLYGAVLERDAPGVVVDSLGVTGATYGTLAALDGESVVPMLEQRRHDLVVFMLGTNFWNSDENPEGLRKLVALFRSLDAGRPILVVTPPDHVKTRHHTQSDPRVLRVIEQLTAASAEHGTALWDFREAMGGDGSMWVFHQRGLAGDDLYHLTSTGARIMGERMAHALLAAHAAHVADHPRAGCRRGS